MQSVILVVHLFIAVSLVGLVLLQRSEGGALGIGGGGGGGGMGGLMSGRGAANAMTRMTAILAAAFFATSITLTLFSSGGGDGASVLDNIDITPAQTSPAGASDSTAPAGQDSGAASQPADTGPAVPLSQ
ncbi:MAG: preprotein translocase subunit SecG [Hyphomicrobiales bacterium]